MMGMVWCEGRELETFEDIPPFLSLLVACCCNGDHSHSVGCPILNPHDLMSDSPAHLFRLHFLFFLLI